MEREYRVKKQKKPTDWTVKVPGSKSITNRALLLAALTDGEVILSNVLFSEDTEVFISSLEALGYDISRDGAKDANRAHKAREKMRACGTEKERCADLRESGARVCGEGSRLRVRGRGAALPSRCGEIYAGSAGTAARFLTVLLGVSDGEFVIRASEQMEKRPMKPLFEAIISLGARVRWLGDKWYLPAEIKGAGLIPTGDGTSPAIETGGRCGAACGQNSGADGEHSAQGGHAREATPPVRISLDISESTQFLSAFLMVAPLLPGGARISVSGGRAEGAYVRMTRRIMEEFGAKSEFCAESEPCAEGGRYRESESCAESTPGGGTYIVQPHAAYRRNAYTVEPDVSAACYFYAAAALTGGRALVRGVHFDSMQGDVRFIRILEEMGCELEERDEGIVLYGSAGGRLEGISVDMRDFSDQALTLAALAPFAQSPVEIKNVAHIRKQESDRIRSAAEALKSLGVRCDELSDGLIIYPGETKGGRIDPHGDHRVAMAFALCGLRCGGVMIEDPSCCEKTFPEYFKILDELCGSTRQPDLQFAQ